MLDVPPPPSIWAQVWRTAPPRDVPEAGHRLAAPRPHRRSQPPDLHTFIISCYSFYHLSSTRMYDVITRTLQSGLIRSLLCCRWRHVKQLVTFHPKDTDNALCRKGISATAEGWHSPSIARSLQLAFIWCIAASSTFHEVPQHIVVFRY